MERRHEEEWARIAWEGDYTFQDVFSMTSLVKSVKFFPWCISTSIPLHHKDYALAATEWQGKTTLATVDVTKLQESSAQGLSSSPTHSIKTLPAAIPVLLDLPFEGTPSMCTHSSSPLLALHRKRGTTFLVGHLPINIGREPWSKNCWSFW